MLFSICDVHVCMLFHQHVQSSTLRVHMCARSLAFLHSRTPPFHMQMCALSFVPPLLSHPHTASPTLSPTLHDTQPTRLTDSDRLEAEHLSDPKVIALLRCATETRFTAEYVRLLVPSWTTLMMTSLGESLLPSRVSCLTSL
jgi:hypothetical protein